MKQKEVVMTNNKCKNILLWQKISSCLLFSIAIYFLLSHVSGNAEAAYDLTGEWTGTFKREPITMNLSQTAGQVTGTVRVNDTVYNLEGTVDNATFYAEGESDNRTLLGRHCEASCAIRSNGEMSGTFQFWNVFKKFSRSYDTTLYNKKYILNFQLLMDYVQRPSNIYLFFSMEDSYGKPVAGFKEDDFELYEDDKLISRYESLQTIIPRSSLFIMATLLLLDMSGSILETETLNFLKASVISFLNQIAGYEGNEVAIYLFDGRENIRELIAFTKDVEALERAVMSLTREIIINDPEYDISTNLNGAVQQGLAVLDAKQASVNAKKLIKGSLVTFTDGTDQAERVSNAAVASSVKESSQASFAIGLGGEIDETHLRAIGKDGFAWAEDADALNGAFDHIAIKIREESEKHYILGYCTPSRKGEHVVTLNAKGFKGSFSYAFNADGFTGGCNPLDIMDLDNSSDNMQCDLTIRPESIKKSSLPKLQYITIKGMGAHFSNTSIVTIEDTIILSTFYFDPTKLSVFAIIPSRATAGPKYLTVTNNGEKFTCFNALIIE